MNGVHAHLTGYLFKKRDGLRSKPAAAKAGLDVQLVDESIVATELKTETDGQHNVANDCGAFVENPNTPKCGKRQKPMKGFTSNGFLKLNLTRLLFGEKAHHAKKLQLVVQGRFPDRQRWHVTRRFVR